MADRCLACHTDVAGQIQAKSGLHGGLVGAQSSPTCRGCHPEHHGPDGALTVVDEATFPHDLTGYSLRGHQRTTEGSQVTCADCHPKDLAHFDQATCADCHATIDATFMSRHEATFGKQCLPCHDGTDRVGANFDHNRLPFKLTGKHAGVACEQVPRQRRVPPGPAEDAPGLRRLPREGRQAQGRLRTAVRAVPHRRHLGATPSSTTPSSRSTTGARSGRPRARRATRPT